MDSTLQAVLASIQQNNYITVAIFTAVGYDYVVTFTNEIEYIWNKPWTRVSSLFLLVRYFGLYSFTIQVLMGSTLISMTAGAYVITLRSFQSTDIAQTVWSFLGLIINLVSQWTWFLFLAAADLVMILRVWAMYNRSRFILYSLLTIYIVENALSCVGVIYYNIPNNTTVAITQILNMSFCSAGSSVTTWTNITSISQLVLGSTMCILVIIRFMRQSIQMYKATNKWQGNRYMNLLAREGVLYFLVIQVFNLVLALATLGKLPIDGPGWILATIMQYVPLFTFTPRFVISMRELYAQDGRGRAVGGIDTAFGLSAISGAGAAGSVMAFAEPGEEQNEGLEGAEEVPMEEGAIREESRDVGVV